MNAKTYELLETCGKVIKAIDDCTDWFLLRTFQKDKAKKQLYETIYKKKFQKLQKLVEEELRRIDDYGQP